MLQEAITATAGLRTRLVNDLTGHDRPDSQADGATFFARRGILAGVQVGQPAGALADPVRLVDQAVADQVAPVQFDVVIPAGVFGCGPARGPQLAQGGIEFVQVRVGG